MGLSDRLALYAAASNTEQDRAMAAEARALEERVAELEAQGRVWMQLLDSDRMRADVAVAEAARMRGEMRGRVVALRDQRDALQRKLEKVRAVLWGSGAWEKEGDAEEAVGKALMLLDGGDSDE